VRPEDIPDWVPSPIRSEVLKWLDWNEHNYREHPDDLTVLRRLVTTPKMRDVWIALKTALNGEPPAEFKRFMFTAYDCAVHPRTVTTPEQLNDEAAKFSTVVEVGRPWIDKQDAKKLGEMVRAMRDRSSRLGADQPVDLSPPTSFTVRHAMGQFGEHGWRPPLVVLKRHKDAEVRAYVLELSTVTYKLFHSILLGTVATTTSVALQTNVTVRQVQEWNSQVGFPPTI
jgi:hypothetical protein